MTCEQLVQATALAAARVWNALPHEVYGAVFVIMLAVTEDLLFPSFLLL